MLDENAGYILQSLMIIQWIINCFSFIMAFYFVKQIKRVVLIHPNLRVLMVNLIYKNIFFFE